MKFKPCSKDCPAVTGRPHGRVRYCPRQEQERHRKFQDGPHRLNVGSKRRFKVDGPWHAYDWRKSMWVLWNEDKPIPPHPDETDCCLDFGCCP